MMKDVIIRVRCPKCGFVQPTRSIKRVKCWQCGHVFKVYIFDTHGRIKKTRIVGIVRGTLQDLHKYVEEELLRPKRMKK